MVLRSILGFFQNLFRSVSYTIMGDSGDVSTDTKLFQVIVPPIPKLGDSHMFWSWRMLVKTYLSAIGLWSKNQPTESPHTKFVLLSTLEMWVLRKEYDDMSCRSIFEDLDERFTSGVDRRNSREIFI
ncbi:uncharacterized protein LOC108135060 [Drosophila elegans]|uniref:uncharacterized protein LOC108135060 n=1 Tax=Drosophila elegans TaxID=30023 RepID=UPI0007E8A293|nr:uncharacterized protein LOC108135060 [Drosophila elegans]